MAKRSAPCAGAAPALAARAPVVACPLCGEMASVPWCAGVVRFGRSYEVRVCPKCDLGITLPPVGTEERERLHGSEGYRGHRERFVGVVERARRGLARSRVRRLERILTPGKLLDVGCGTGAFLVAARDRGWEVCGVELTPETARFARESWGLDVRTGAPDSWGFGEASFDAVTLWHVLEHVPDPLFMLRHCAMLLRRGGTVVVSVPNLRSAQAKLAGGHWFHLDLPYHAVHFSPSSLVFALEESGFDVMSVDHGSSEHGPFGVLQSVLNLLGFEENALFEALKDRGERGGSRGRGWGAGTVGCMALVPLLGPLSAALALGESALGKGGVITACARRSAP